MTAAPDFSLAGLYLFTWFFPMAISDTMLNYLLSVMLLEFFVIHASGFLGAYTQEWDSGGFRLGPVLGLGAFYTIFVGGFAVIMGEPWLIAAFWMLILNQLMGQFLGQGEPEERAQIRAAGWVARAVFYVGGVTLTMILPLPALGVSKEFYTLTEASAASGEWIDRPQTMLALGVLYFGAVGWFELNARAFAAKIKVTISQGGKPS
ncbi:MAG: hypothetical protein HY804_11545 [Nitrospinae bacterium]|nr:hypothetical protein [Nitrospinota bacterium]